MKTGLSTQLGQQLHLTPQLLQSIRLLADAAVSFADRCVTGIAADETRIGELVERQTHAVEVI